MCVNLLCAGCRWVSLVCASNIILGVRISLSAPSSDQPYTFDIEARPNDSRNVWGAGVKFHSQVVVFLPQRASLPPLGLSGLSEVPLERSLFLILRTTCRRAFSFFSFITDDRGRNRLRTHVCAVAGVITESSKISFFVAAHLGAPFLSCCLCSHHCKNYAVLTVVHSTVFNWCCRCSLHTGFGLLKRIYAGFRLLNGGRKNISRVTPGWSLENQVGCFCSTQIPSNAFPKTWAQF